MHKEILAKLVSLGRMSKEQAVRTGRGLDRLKQSGAIGLYHFRENQLKEKLKSKRKRR